MSVIQTMRSDPQVIFAELNMQVRSQQEQAIPSEIPPREADVIPFKYLSDMRAYEAWYTLRSLDLRRRAQISILDEDFDNPPDDPTRDLNDVPSIPYIDDLTGRWDLFSDRPTRTSTHGFMVATLCAAPGNNNRRPVGINWHSPLRLISLPLSVRSWQDGSLEYILLYHISAELGGNGAAVVNLSLGPPTNKNGEFEAGEDLQHYRFFRMLVDILNRLQLVYPAKKFLVVKSAGNDAIPMDRRFAHSRLLTVGVYRGDRDAIADYSNSGTLVDLYVRANWDGYFPMFETDYRWVELYGTSFAAPLVTGVISLMWEVNPDLSPDEIRTRLLRACQEINGNRVLDMYAAIAAAADVPPTAFSGVRAIAAGDDHSLALRNDGSVCIRR